MELFSDEDRFGKCKRIGVGYTETKQGIIAPREQLILGGMQEYENGATILWGTGKSALVLIHHVNCVLRFM